MAQSNNTDHVYYNGYVHNKTTDVCFLTFDQQMNLNFISNPQEWEMSIIKFSLPNTLPYFLLGVNNLVGGGYTDTTRSFSIIKTDAFGVITNHTASCVFYPTTFLAQDITTTPHRGAYLYEQNNIYEIIKAFNVAINAAWVSAGLVSGDSPTFTFSPTTGLFSLNLNATAAGILSNTVPPPTITNNTYQLYASWTMFDIFQSFDTYGYGGIPYSVAGGLAGNYNTLFRFPTMVGAQVITQEYPTTSFLSKIRSILVTTSTLPVLNEEFPDFKVNQTSTGISFITSSTSSKTIVSDFSLGSDPALIQKQGLLNYLPTAEYRMIDLVGAAPIKNINIQFNILSSESTNTAIYPMKLFPNQTAQVKILFRKRAMKTPIKEILYQMKEDTRELLEEERELLEKKKTKKKK